MLVEVVMTRDPKEGAELQGGQDMDTLEGDMVEEHKRCKPEQVVTQHIQP